MSAFYFVHASRHSCFFLFLPFCPFMLPALPRCCSLLAPLSSPPCFPPLRLRASRTSPFPSADDALRSGPLCHPSHGLSPVRTLRMSVFPLRLTPPLRAASSLSALSLPPVPPACSLLARPFSGLMPIQASETLVCGAASRSPSQADPIFPFFYFCRGSGQREHAVSHACRAAAL